MNKPWGGRASWRPMRRQAPRLQGAQLRKASVVWLEGQARDRESGVSEMVLESQGPRQAGPCQSNSRRVTDLSPASSLASFSYLLVNPVLTEGPLCAWPCAGWC